jgi:hypothetical protein
MADDGKALNKIADEIDEATAFPIMVSDGFAVMTGAPAGAPSAPTDLGATALSAIKNTLGWSWRPGADPKGLMSALNQTFKAIPRQGRVDYVYQPKTYAVAIQADMGMITGAQASLYTRAKAALDQMLLLLAGLTPLLPDPDLSETEAIRSLVRVEITDVVQQLGAEGGPNVQLVDKAFTFLGGNQWTVKERVRDAKTLTFDKIGGHLGELRKAFGMEERWVNTIAEEQNLTNYIVLVDYVNTLFSSWRTNRLYFVGGPKTFMGTQLIQVSRALAVVAESVEQLCYVMDTVFIQRAERQTLKLDFGDGKPPMFLADLLEWVKRFVTDEGRQIINDSGKDGVQTFTATARRLRELVASAKTVRRVPRGFKTKRVQDAFDNLVEQLDNAIQEAEHIKRYPAPKIDWVELELEDERLRATVFGHNLSESATIFLGIAKPDSATASGVIENGVSAPTFVSGASNATAIFEDGNELSRLLSLQVTEFIRTNAKTKAIEYWAHLVIRNADDQTDMVRLSEANHKVVMSL